MDKIVTDYRVRVDSVQPDKRNPQASVVRCALPDSTYYYLFNAPNDLGLAEGQWYDVRVFVKAVGYTDRETGKVRAFLSTWVLSAAVVPVAAVA